MIFFIRICLRLLFWQFRLFSYTARHLLLFRFDPSIYFQIVFFVHFRHDFCVSTRARVCVLLCCFFLLICKFVRFLWYLMMPCFTSRSISWIPFRFLECKQFRFAFNVNCISSFAVVLALIHCCGMNVTEIRRRNAEPKLAFNWVILCCRNNQSIWLKKERGQANTWIQIEREREKGREEANSLLPHKGNYEAWKTEMESWRNPRKSICWFYCTLSCNHVLVEFVDNTHFNEATHILCCNAFQDFVMESTFPRKRRFKWEKKPTFSQEMIWIGSDSQFH